MSSSNPSLDQSFSDDTETFHVHQADEATMITHSVSPSMGAVMPSTSHGEVSIQTEPVCMVECGLQCNLYEESAIDAMVEALESKKRRLLTEVTELISLRDDLKHSSSNFAGPAPSPALSTAEIARRVAQQDLARLTNPQQSPHRPYKTSPARLLPHQTCTLSRPVSPAINRTMNMTVTHDMSAQFRLSFKQPSSDLFSQTVSPAKRSTTLKSAPARPNSPTFISNTASSFIIPDTLDVDSADENDETVRTINVPANSPTPGSPVSFVGSAKWPAPLRATNPPIKQSLKQSIFDDSEQQWANTMVDTKTLFEGANLPVNQSLSQSLDHSIKHSINMTQKQAALRSSLIDITNYRASPSSSPAQSPLRPATGQSDVEKPRVSQRSLFHHSQEDLLYE